MTSRLFSGFSTELPFLEVDDFILKMLEDHGKVERCETCLPGETIYHSRGRRPMEELKEIVSNARKGVF